MKLQKLNLKRYKCFREDVNFEIAPLTILFGANNSGKTALVRAIHLLASSLVLSENNSHEPLLLRADEIRHGRTFVDLVNGYAIHGKLSLSAELANGSNESLLNVTVQNVEKPPKPDERQILNWCLASGTDRIEAQRKSLDPQSLYDVSVSGREPNERPIAWKGVLPQKPHQLPNWIDPQIEEIRKWANGVRYLKCPRRIASSHFTTGSYSIGAHDTGGMHAPMALAADNDLWDSVREWYRKAFGVRLELKAEGRYFDLIVRSNTNGAGIPLDQSGAGLSQVLPVAVAALTANQSGPGVDIIEHPETGLQPAAHAYVAELFLEHLAKCERSTILETHSEMILLRTRRWIAEKRLSPEDVLVYWLFMDPDDGAGLRKITINERGQMGSWPHGIFTEDYEEVLAIRRAVANNEAMNTNAHNIGISKAIDSNVQ